MTTTLEKDAVQLPLFANFTVDYQDDKYLVGHVRVGEYGVYRKEAPDRWPIIETFDHPKNPPYALERALRRCGALSAIWSGNPITDQSWRKRD